MLPGSPKRNAHETSRGPRLNHDTVKLLTKMSPEQLVERLDEIELAGGRVNATRRRAVVAAKDYVDRYRRDPAPVLLWISVLLPTVDSLLDWVVTADLFFSDNPSYLKLFAVQLVSGYFMGVVFVFTLMEEGGLARIGLAMLAGMAGMVPGAILLSAFCTDTGNVRDSRQAIVPYLAVQLLLEAVPQSVVQSYLGITEGMIDGQSEAYSPLVVASIATSVFGAGLSIFSIDTRLRPEVDFVPQYAVIAIAGYTATTCALVFWGALMSCAFGAAVFWLVLMCVFFCCFCCVTTRCVGADLLARWGAQKREHAKAQKVEEADGGKGDDEDRPVSRGIEEQSRQPTAEVKVAGKRRDALWLACSFVSFLIMLLIMSQLFGSAEHARNNYANTSALPGAPGGVSDDNPTGDSFLSCEELPVGWDVASTATIASVILTLLSWMVDPNHGVDCLRPKSWRERVARRIAPMSQKEVDMAKAHAVFLWGDIFGEGFIGPQEIYRMAGVLGVGYGRVCYELGVKALSERQLDEYFRTESGRKKLSARERVILLQAVARASIDEFHFVSNPAQSIHQWFEELRLMVKN